MPRILTLLVLLLPLTLPYLWSRIQVLRTFEANHPSTLQRRGSVVEAGNYEVKFPNVLRNCEDLVLDIETGVAIVGCDEGRDSWNTVMGHFNTGAPIPNGRLHLYTYSDTRPHLEEIRLINTPENYTFHPLGLSYHVPTATLSIVNHGLSASTIDIYSFSRHGNSATYIRGIESPYLRSPNAVEHLDATSLVATNDHYFLARHTPWLAKLETYLGLPLGGVVHVDLASDAVTPLARVPFANGVAVVDAATLAVASSSTASVYIFDIVGGGGGGGDDTAPRLRLREKIRLRFAPDNLSVDARGALLVAGHAHLRSFNAFCRSRVQCKADTASAGCEGPSPFFAVEWTRAGGLRELYVGDEVDTGSSVVRDTKRGVGLVSGLYGKGLLVWEEEKEKEKENE